MFDAFAGCDAILHAGDIHELWLLDQLGEVAPVFAARGNGDEGFGGRVRARAGRAGARHLDPGPARGGLPAATLPGLRVGIIHDLTDP